MCTINEDQIIYGSWNIRCDRHKFLSFCTIFCPFRPLMTWKIKILKLKKTTGDIILHMCNINDNHMMYDSWDMEHDEQNFMLFWTFFCPFTSLKARKIKILKTWKKNMEILSFYTSVPKIFIICYTVPEMWRGISKHFVITLFLCYKLSL